MIEYEKCLAKNVFRNESTMANEEIKGNLLKIYHLLK